MPIETSIKLNLSPDAALQTLKTTGEKLGWKIKGLDASRLVIQFNTGLSWRTWRGVDIIAAVSQDDTGSNVSIQSAMAGAQTYDWGEVSSKTKAFLSELQKPIAAGALTRQTLQNNQVDSQNIVPGPIGELRSPTVGQRAGHYIIPILMIGLIIFFAVSMLAARLTQK